MKSFIPTSITPSLFSVETPPVMADATVSRTVHLIIQGKGGIGKSYISSLVYQYLDSAGRSVKGFDTDPLNATFTSYDQYDVTHINLLTEGEINDRAMDDMLQAVLAAEGDVVIDVGASSFIPLCSFVLETDMLEILNENGMRTVLHPVIAGGQALPDTLIGFDALATQFPDNADLIVWVNEYFGPVEVDGQCFEEMPLYAKHLNRMKGVIKLSPLKQNTSGQDVQEMLTARVSFSQAIEDDQVLAGKKRRLQKTAKAIFSQMDLMGF